MTSDVLGPWIERSAGGPVRASFALPTPAPRPELPEIVGLLAGAAEVDITPPPGMPKAGHSRNARDGAGFRTRLRVRAVHLRAGRTSLALVAADLHSGSAVLNRLVADRLAATDIGIGSLFLGSTHTHAGPGQFHGCDFYNRWASNRAGLDPVYTQFLVDQISGAVLTAYQTRRPARLATGGIEVFGFTRNRSLAAHVRNSTVADKRTGAARKYSAINPWLHLLRVDTEEGDGGLRPLAALAWFSIHGTGISRRDPAYNADVWAYITGEAAARIEARTGTRPLVGAVEGTHGDMTPAVRPGLLAYHEAERVGRGIGQAAAELHARLEVSLSSDVQLGSAYREIDLRERPVIAGVRLPDPAVGAAKLAGAVENSTPVLDRIPPFRAGCPKPGFLSVGPGGRSHGAKWVFGSRVLQHRVAPVDSFPRVLPVQLLRLGDLAVLALPFEVTVEAGRHLQEVMTAAADPVGPSVPATLTVLAGEAGPTVVVSSAANDYWDYLTTPAEYHLQCYEGASNLYGPRTLDFVAGAVAGLAQDLAARRSVEDVVVDRRFVGLVRRFGSRTSPGVPGPTSPSATSPSRGLFFERGVAGPPTLIEATVSEDAYWEFRWSAGPPGSLQWDRPLARVEAAVGPERWAPAPDPAGGSVDDQGWHLGVLHLGPAPGAGRDQHSYAIRWFSPPLGSPGRWRFVLEANGNYPELVSDPFD